jgi:signal transduction histidine kinase/HD-like signal output (HDOD) protein
MHTAPPHADQDRASRIELILRQVDTLPTLSPIATRLLEIAGAEDADLDRIVEIIESDPAMTARMLGLCRRADKGLGDRITTVRRAVVMLGLEAVQAAALSVAVYDLMEQWAPAAEDRDVPLGAGAGTFDREGFWRYSVAVGCASELVAEAHRDLGVKPDEAFVAGLVHGLGKLVLDLILPRSYARVIGLAERRMAPSSEIEQQILGIDHHTAGKRLAEHWGLPFALQDTIWLCGQTGDSIPELPHRNLIRIVSVAGALCRHLHIGWAGDYNHPEPLDGPRGLCPRHGMNAERVEACVPRLHDEVIRRCKVLGLADVTTGALLLQSVAAANRKLGRIGSMFEQRARSAQRQARILSTISAFHSGWRPGLGVLDSLAEVVRSAVGFFGQGYFATVHQMREGEPWQLCQFGPDARLERSCGIEPPHPSGGGRSASLHELCSSDVHVGALALIPWLTDYLVESADIRAIQVLPLTRAGDDPEGAPGPAIVLLHDAAIRPGERGLLAPLAATWAAAVIAAAQHEGARRLGERLASANRTLSETQARLAESQSLARLGEMAAGAAHEMNNPLTVISGRAQLLCSRLGDPSDRSVAGAIVEACGDLTDLITSLRLVADPPRPRLKACTIGEVVDCGLRLASARGEPTRRVRVSLTGTLPRPRVDCTLLGTALAELLANALQAGEGEVSLSARGSEADSYVDIVLSDEGAGMTPRALQHAFDPFFSEKPAGRRTGLGLTRARALVQLHRGEITLESRPGQGTTATIRIPLNQAETEPLTRAA